MSIKLVVVALYAINLWLRTHETGNAGTPLILSLVAVGLLAISGWLGGSMVVHGAGVDHEPHDGAVIQSRGCVPPFLTPCEKMFFAADYLPRVLSV